MPRWIFWFSKSLQRYVLPESLYIYICIWIDLSSMINSFLACECNVDGSVDTKCSTPEGKCTCNDGVGGDKCDVCKTEHFGFPTCESMHFQ